MMTGDIRFAAMAALALACLSPAGAETQIERGRYVATIAACVSCHTARTPDAPMLAGGNRLGSGPHATVSPNITPDDATGIGRWSKADIVAALRRMRRPDGTPIGPPMPQHAYVGLSDEDAAAIAAFLESVPPAHNPVAAAISSKPSPTAENVTPGRATRMRIDASAGAFRAATAPWWRRR